MESLLLFVFTRHGGMPKAVYAGMALSTLLYLSSLICKLYVKG